MNNISRHKCPLNLLIMWPFYNLAVKLLSLKRILNLVWKLGYIWLPEHSRSGWTPEWILPEKEKSWEARLETKLNWKLLSPFAPDNCSLHFCLKSTRYFAPCFADNCLLLFRSESRKLLVFHVPDNCSRCFYLSDKSCSLEREICCTAGIEIPLHHAFNKISAERRPIPFMQQIVCKTLKLQS